MSDRTLLRTQPVSVYFYSREESKWFKQDSKGSVFIVFEVELGKYRIRAVSSSNQELISAPIVGALAHERRGNFIQFKKERSVYGLKFRDSTDGDKFEVCLRDAIGKATEEAPRHQGVRRGARSSAGGSDVATNARRLFVNNQGPLPQRYVCCRCGVEKSDLVLKVVERGEVEGVRLKLSVSQKSNRLCTSCWIENLR